MTLLQSVTVEAVSLRAEWMYLFSRRSGNEKPFSASVDLLVAAVDEAKTERSVGQAAEVDGRIAMVRHTEADRQRTVLLLTSIVESVERHCEIVPAYGPSDVPHMLLQFKELLDDESYDAISLCLEKNGNLFTIDARLRALALSGFQVSSMPPPLAMVKAAQAGQFSLAAARNFQMLSLVSNRTYVQVTSYDFLWMLCQAKWSDSVLEAWANVLSSEGTLFQSAVVAVCGVFEALHLIDIQGAAAATVVERLALAIYRHPSFYASAERAMHDALQKSVKQIFSAPPWHPSLSASLAQQARSMWEFFRESLIRVRDVAKDPSAAVTHRLVSLYCACRPVLLEMFRASGDERDRG